MSGSTTKKVCVRCLNQRLISGYVSPPTCLRPDGVEILDRTAQARLIPYKEIRAIYFVREFEDDPEANQKRVFATRPKGSGLWVRLSFHDGEILEGIVPNNLLQMEGHGVTVTPPDPNANTQRIFVPRAALRELTVLGVIGSPVHRRRARLREPSEDQLELFQKGQSPPKRPTRRDAKETGS